MQELLSLVLIGVSLSMDTFSLSLSMGSLIKENNYIHKIINALSFGDDKVERFFRQIEVVLNTYIDKKIS